VRCRKTSVEDTMCRKIGDIHKKWSTQEKDKKWKLSKVKQLSFLRPTRKYENEGNEKNKE
jgi:hypothetical protein